MSRTVINEPTEPTALASFKEGLKLGRNILQSEMLASLHDVGIEEHILHGLSADDLTKVRTFIQSWRERTY